MYAPILRHPPGLPSNRGLACLCLALAALGCGGHREAGTAELEPPRWERVDLWSRQPVVERQPPGGEDAWQARLGWLGAREVRPVERLSERDLRAMPTRPAPQIRVLAQRVGSRLAWELDVPADRPYWSLIPLGTRDTACACTLRAGVRDADGELHELYRTAAQDEPRFAPATVELDLSPYAGTRVELLLQADLAPGAKPPGGEPPWVEWGSPALYGAPGPRQAGAATPTRTADAPPNVLILGLDTLRYDALGERWDGPSLTPALDRLATESDVWTAAFATANATNPSFASIFTGLYAKDHGVYDLHTPLPGDYLTLAEIYQQAGYDTFAAIAARHLGPEASGLGQGFDTTALSDSMDAGELIADLGMEWIAAHESGEGGAGDPAPWFGWLHFFDPHTPHTPPQPYALGLRPRDSFGLGPVGGWTMFRQPGPREFVHHILAGNKDLYDGEVAYLDRQLDRLLGFLAGRELLERTVVVVVADHGESLGEHGILYRHVGLHDQTTHVPLMIRWPEPLLPGPAWQRRRGRRIGGLVQTLDLFPTLLAASNLEAPESAGTDLRRLTVPPGTDPSAADRAATTGRRAVFAEHANRQGAMVRTGQWKYIVSEDSRFLPDGASLFDLEKDPLETVNLAGRGLPIEQELADLLARWRADGRLAGSASKPGELDEERRQELRSLGYLQ